MMPRNAMLKALFLVFRSVLAAASSPSTGMKRKVMTHTRPANGEEVRDGSVGDVWPQEFHSRTVGLSL